MTRAGLLQAGAIVFCAIPTSAAAQELDRATPLLETPGEYAAQPIRLGAGAVYASADVRIEYDSNVYAENAGAIDDFRVIASPYLNYRLSNERLELDARAQAAIRRYFENEQENTEAGGLDVTSAYKLSAAGTINANAGWSRVVEERGEPESETSPGTPPRKYNHLSGELGYTHQGARFTVRAVGVAFENDALAAADAERDYRQYSGALRPGYRVSGTLSVFGEGFLVVRDFRLATDASGLDRDSRTYGGRAGVQIDPGGLLQGEAAVGLFRFEPDDPTLASRTGLSISAGLIYTPTPRLAFTLDAFRGDVATFRSGAQGRTDTRVRVGVQQEIYHNLRWQGSLIYRRSNFVGSNQKERTLAGVVDLEYLVSRNVAIALNVRVANRDSSIPTDDFDRTRVGLELRLHI